MNFPRSSGLLLHPTSLPGPYGIGDFGDEAYRFVDFLAASGQKLWQVLPLGPTGYGDSPYAFAGNTLLINPDRLLANDLVKQEDLDNYTTFPTDRIDFDHRFSSSLLEAIPRIQRYHITSNKTCLCTQELTTTTPQSVGSRVAWAKAQLATKTKLIGSVDSV